MAQKPRRCPSCGQFVGSRPKHRHQTPDTRGERDLTDDRGARTAAKVRRLVPRVRNRWRR